MSEVRALIAEDEAPQREALQRLLAELWPGLAIVTCADGIAALEALHEFAPHVVFLDIRMPGASGLDVARAASGRAHVVFTTAYDEYAVNAFEHGAVDYLLKPVARERLQTAIARVRDRLASAPAALDALIAQLQLHARAQEERRWLRWISAGIGDTVRLIAIEDVQFFQAQDKYTRVATRDGDALIRVPLKELLAQLDPELFWQVHRSAIVNARAIERVRRDELGRLQLHVRDRNESLPVSSACQHRFRTM
jgi:DNA-binding LytR/AlgR family response regulator